MRIFLLQSLFFPEVGRDGGIQIKQIVLHGLLNWPSSPCLEGVLLELKDVQQS